MLRLTILLVLMCGLVPDVFGANCDDYWTSFGNSCYRYIEIQMDWAEAEGHCWYGYGAHLTGINSEAENNFVAFMIGGEWDRRTDAWHGYNDQGTEGTWRNVDGSPSSYTSWNGGEPNNSGNNEDCATTNEGNRGKWNDARCNDNRKYFVCEKPSK